MYDKHFWPRPDGANYTYDQCRAACWYFHDANHSHALAPAYADAESRAIAIRFSTRWFHQGRIMGMADATQRNAAAIDISSEQYRRYTYADRSVFRIEAPIRVTITDTGSHRVEDASGETHRPTLGWIAISWKPKVGEPPFVA